MSRDHSAAKKFRDVVASIARGEIEKMFPPDRYAKVHEIREAERRVIVQYNGEGPENLVSVPYNSVKPAYVDQWVRIGGGAGDRHVIDTLGGTAVENRTEGGLIPSRRQRRLVEHLLGALESMPTWLLADPDPANSTAPNLDVAANAIAGTVVRIPYRTSVSAIRYRNDTTRSDGHLRFLLYQLTPNFDAVLLAQSGEVSGASGADDAVLDSTVSLERGTEVLVAVHNRTGSTVSIRGRKHYAQYFSDPRNATSYRTTGHTTVPSTILDVQWSDRYLDRSWWFTLKLES